MLLTGSQLRDRLETQLKTSFCCRIFSGFFTLPAARWIIDNRISGRECIIVTRGLVEDFTSGASSLDAIQAALNAGYDVGISTALHAKIYAFDETLYSGSSNLTAKGLALTENANDELSVGAPITDRDNSLLDNIWSQSVKVDDAKLKKMRDYIDEASRGLADKRIKTLGWPDDIFAERRDLYCSDFPQSFPATERQWSTSEEIMQSLGYRWLERFVADNGPSHFGKLTAQLHVDLYDDPKPYRTDVKSLLSNLLQVIELVGDTKLTVSRPRHSQVVQIKQ